MHGARAALLAGTLLALLPAACHRTAYRTYTCAEPAPSRSTAVVRQVGVPLVGGVVLRGDSARRPAPWASVTLRPAAAGPERRQWVREDGVFRLLVPAPGTYTLEVRGLSLAPADVPLRLAPDSGAEVRLEMEVRPTVINEACGARVAVRVPWWRFW